MYKYICDMQTNKREPSHQGQIRAILLGLVSRGPAACGVFDHGSVASWVPSHIDWIMNKTGNRFENDDRRVMPYTGGRNAATNRKSYMGTHIMVLVFCLEIYQCDG